MPKEESPSAKLMPSAFENDEYKMNAKDKENDNKEEEDDDHNDPITPPGSSQPTRRRSAFLSPVGLAIVIFCLLIRLRRIRIIAARCPL